MSPKTLSILAVPPQPDHREDDNRERLAALWALRLVLDTRQGRKLLGDPIAPKTCRRSSAPGSTGRRS